MIAQHRQAAIIGESSRRVLLHKNIHFGGNLQVKSLPEHQQNKQFDTGNNILSTALHHANVDHHLVFSLADTRRPV